MYYVFNLGWTGVMCIDKKECSIDGNGWLFYENNCWEPDEWADTEEKCKMLLIEKHFYEIDTFIQDIQDSLESINESLKVIRKFHKE